MTDDAVGHNDADVGQTRLLRKVLHERIDHPKLGWFWLSFSNPSHDPDDRGPIGVAVVQAHGVVSAALRAGELGINPGGEVMCVELPEGDLEEHGVPRNVLLSPAQAMEWGERILT